MTQLNRREFLQSSGLAAGALTLGACGSSTGGGNGASPSQFVWWDQFQPLKQLNEKVFSRFEKRTGTAVNHRITNPDKQGQALQLARQSDQMPDVFTIAGLDDIPPAQLHENGWFAPLAWDESTRKALPRGSVVPGLHIFDGELYSFPIFTFRQYETLAWFNTELFAQAGLDPNAPPRTWDEFRAAARAIAKSGDQAYGWIAPLAFTGRLAAETDELAQAAGFSGVEGVNLHTGEYGFDSDPYVAAVEFLLSLKRDGILFPASSSLDARQARARWAAGTAGFFFDGPWNLGVIKDQFPSLLDKLGVGPMPGPEGPGVIHKEPLGGTFWIAEGSKQVKEASKLLSQFLQRDYQRGLAAQMDQPPLDLSVVEEAEVHPAYRRLVGFYKDQVLLAPSPAANPNVARVLASMKEVTPKLGSIVQGAFSGDVSNVRAALRKYTDQMSAAREQAVQEVRKKGIDVSVDDWAFPDWDPKADFTPGDSRG